MPEVILTVNYLNRLEAERAGFEMTADLGAGLYELRAQCEFEDTDEDATWAHVTGESLALRARWDTNRRSQSVYVFDETELYMDIEEFANDEPGEFYEPDLEPEQARNLAAAIKGPTQEFIDKYLKQ